MKIAITDACVFIDLQDVELTTSFFSLNLEIHTSLDVMYELYLKHRSFLMQYHDSGKLILHNLTEQDRNQILSENYPKSLSEMDKTVLHLALKMNAIVLSSDRVVRNFAKSKNLEFHGILWIFERLVDEQIISFDTACSKLIQLISNNVFYQNNPHLMKEVKLMLERWKDYSLHD